MTSSVNA